MLVYRLIVLRNNSVVYYNNSGEANQKILSFISFALRRGGLGGAAKNDKDFLGLLRRFSLRKEQSYFNIFVCSFLHPHGDRGALVSALSGNANVREPHTIASA